MEAKNAPDVTLLQAGPWFVPLSVKEIKEAALLSLKTVGVTDVVTTNSGDQFEEVAGTGHDKESALILINSFHTAPTSFVVVTTAGRDNLKTSVLQDALQSDLARRLKVPAAKS